MTVEAVRVLLEAMRVIIEAVRKIIEAVRKTIEALRLFVEAVRVLCFDLRLWNNFLHSRFDPVKFRSLFICFDLAKFWTNLIRFASIVCRVGLTTSFFL